MSIPKVASVGATGRFKRSNRLLDSKDYVRVMRRGRRRASPELVVITAPIWNKDYKNGDLKEKLPIDSRLGITASRKVGKAVVRNRFKRRIRSWFRARRSDFERPVDLVVIARRSGACLSLDELDEHLSRLLNLPPSPERIR